MASRSKLNSVQGKKVLITAGPTREYWDPVRYLTNASSGTMGIALAREAQRLGARVTLVLGPVESVPRESLKGVTIVRVVSAQDMERAVQEHLKDTQIFIGAAAVADYRPAILSKTKIKKNGSETMLRLVRNPDIIAKVARRRPERPYVVIGFALETHEMIENAQKKLLQKGLDWIVANRDTNIGNAKGSATLLSRWGERIPLGKMSKARLARRIWEALLLRPAI